MTTRGSDAVEHVAGHPPRPPADACGERAGAGSPLVAFAVRICPYREAVHLKLAGELDIATVDTLQAELARVLARGFWHVVIDLRELEFIDAAGLRLLLALTNQALREGWRLSVVQGPTAVRRVFELTGTLDELPFTPPLSAVSAPRVRSL